MNIELTPQEIDEIKQRIVTKLEKEAYTLAKSQLDHYMKSGQFIGEIRNIVVQEVVPVVKDHVLNDMKAKKILETSVNAAKRKIDTEIHKKLMGGIVVKFAGDIIE